MNLFLGKSSPGVLKLVHLMNLYLKNKLQSSPSELDIIEKQVKSSPGELKNKIKIKISSLGELDK